MKKQRTRLAVKGETLRLITTNLDAVAGGIPVQTIRNCVTKLPALCGPQTTNGACF